MSVFNRERAARVLVEALYSTDQAVAQAHNVSDRSLRNWRARLDTEPEFAALFLELKAKAEADWADALFPAIRCSVDFLRRAAVECDAADPAAVHSIAGSLKILSEVAMTQQVIGARLSQSVRSQDEADREVATEAPSEPRIH